MDIVITGGTGFIGTALVKRLVAAGHGVTALVRGDASASKAAALGAKPVVGDLFDTDFVTSAFAAADGALHLAATGDARTQELDQGIAEAVVRAYSGTQKPYVHSSGIWIYGPGTAITEDTEFDAPAIVAWRAAVEKAVLNADVPTTIVVPGVVYGGGQGIPALLKPASGRVQLVGSGSQHWPTVHVDDIAALYELALSQGSGLGYLIGASASPTVRSLGEAAGLPVETETVDEARARLGAYFADAVLQDQVVTSTKARSLGWEPTGPTLADELRTGSYAAA